MNGRTNNKGYGSIFNNDINNILYAMDKNEATPEKYQSAVYAILDTKPGVLAQNVGMPEAVIYKSDVENTFDKYLSETTKMTWPDADISQTENEDLVLKSLLEQDRDPLQLTIEACRKRGVKIVASYRMNAEDCYDNTWLLSDFGRAHPEYRIKDPDIGEYSYGHKKLQVNEKYFGCLDPAIPEVYKHRMEIFTEAASNYDIDGIEFDFRRWLRMISSPLENYPILTQMVRDTRMMLDRISKEKNRDRMLLGVRVGPSIDDRGRIYDGGNVNNDKSSMELGLDVKTWISEGIVDYICPSLFWPSWPGLPKTSEFVELAMDKDIGIYPTLFPLPGWLSEEGPYKGPIDFSDKDKMQRYKDEFCDLALKLYEDGADGISTFNWYFHFSRINMKHVKDKLYGPAGFHIQWEMVPILGYPDEIRKYRSSII